MSDFVTTMKYWKTMCNYFEKKNKQNSNACEGCPLESLDTCGAIFEIDTVNGGLDEVEQIVNDWYANNSICWFEYLQSIIPGLSSLSDTAAIQTLLETAISPELYEKLKNNE